jgi:hypothetical protein
LVTHTSLRPSRRFSIVPNPILGEHPI